MNVKGKIKFVIISFLVITLICATHIRPKETTTKPCSVIQTETIDNLSDIYEVTVVDTDGNLWAYYDDIPREIDVVLMCEFNGDEIISVTERR